MSIPTFDEWYEKKYLSKFEKDYMAHGMSIAEAMVALSRFMREYVSEMMKGEVK